MTAATGLDALRKPFPAAVVGVLPKPYKKESPKGNCPDCKGYHGMPAAHLDFVGHAAVTDRLLSVDSAWTWEPVALDSDGLPAYDRSGGLWIRLTVCGVTRLGYGDGPDPKQRIGDAIRNAAMRFGVALDLWTKGELESTDPNGGDAAQKQQPTAPVPDAEQNERQHAKAELWKFARSAGYDSPVKLAADFAGWSSGLALSDAPVADLHAFLQFLMSEAAASDGAT